MIEWGFVFQFLFWQVVATCSPGWRLIALERPEKSACRDLPATKAASKWSTRSGEGTRGQTLKYWDLNLCIYLLPFYPFHFLNWIWEKTRRWSDGVLAGCQYGGNFNGISCLSSAWSFLLEVCRKRDHFRHRVHFAAEKELEDFVVGLP